MIIGADVLNDLKADAYDYGIESYEYEQAKEIWPLIYEEKKIEGDGWQRTSVVTPGTWTRTRYTQGYTAQSVVEGYTSYMRVWDFTIAIPVAKNVARDSRKLKNFTQEMSKSIGETAPKTREEFYARPFNKGGMTSGDWVFNGDTESGSIADGYDDMCYDNKPFFNLSGNTRSAKNGDTFYNGHALDLSADNLKTVYLRGKSVNNREENGTVIRIPLDCLLVPPALSLTADETLNSTLAPYVSTNTKNVFSNSQNGLNSRLQAIEWDYLDDTNAWFVGTKKKGICAYERQTPEFDVFEDKLSRVLWITGELRIGFMMWNWRFWNGSNFSTT